MTTKKQKPRWRTVILERLLYTAGVAVFLTVIIFGYAIMVWLFPWLAYQPANRQEFWVIATLYTLALMAILAVVALVLSMIGYVVVKQVRLLRNQID